MKEGIALTRSELKAKAKNQIGSNLLILVICHLIVGLIGSLGFITSLVTRLYYYGTQIKDMWITTSPFSSYTVPVTITVNQNYTLMSLVIFLLSLVVFFIVPGLDLGLITIYLGLTENKKATIKDLFSKMNILLRALWLNILTFLLVFAWTLLLIIPGIVKTFAYSMAPYILAENPDITAREAITRSKIMMKGYKLEYFVLSLSFIWWHLLGCITLGVAYIYVWPYIVATNTNFYKKIKVATEEHNESYESISEEI